MKKIKALLLIIILASTAQLHAVEPDPSQIYYNNGNFGVGTTTPQMKLSIVGTGLQITNPDGDKIGKIAFNQYTDLSSPLFCGLYHDWLTNDLYQRGRSLKFAYTTPDASGGIRFYQHNPPSIRYKEEMALVNGRLGIGITNPSTTLHVSGNATITQGLVSNGTIQATRFIGDGSGITNLPIGNSQWTTDAGGNIVFANGNVGVGKLSPVFTQVGYFGTTNFKSFTVFNPLGNRAGVVEIGGTNPSPGVGNGFGLLSFVMALDNIGGGTRIKQAANITAFRDTNGDTGALLFSTLSSGSYATERMRINSSGNVGIGITNPTQKLEVAGAISATRFIGDGSGLTNLPTGTSGSWPSTPYPTETLQFNPGGNPQKWGAIAVNSGHSNTYNGMGLFSNQKSDGSQGNTSVSSWFVDIGGLDRTQGWGDEFGVYRKAAGGSKYASLFKIAENGNVGIGTIRPDTALTIERNGSKTPAFRTYTGVVNEEIMSFNAIEGLQLMCYQNVDGSPSTKASVIIANGDGIAPSQLEIWTKELGSSSPSRRMIVSSIGKVGIGTAAPSTSLHVVSSGTTISTFESTSAANLAYIALKNAAGQHAFIGNDSSGALHFQTPGGDFSSKLVIDSSGKVGIGTQDPTQKLQVKGQVLVGQNIGNASGLYIKSEAGNTHYNWKISTQEKVDTGFEISSSTTVGGTTFNSPAFVILQNGNIGIGTVSPTEKLTIKGGLIASKINVKAPENIPDYVFEEDYNLLPLEEVEAYYKVNKHLPGILSEKEIKKSGKVDMGDMQMKLLEKIEELTIYVVEQQKEINAMQKEINRLKQGR